MAKVLGQIDEFTILHKLGEGLTSQVYAATAPDGQEVAVKMLDTRNPRTGRQAIEYMKVEFENTKQLQHKNVVRYHACREEAKF